MKQSQTFSRPTKFATSDARKKFGEALEEKLDKIYNYQNFVKEIGSHVTHFRKGFNHVFDRYTWPKSSPIFTFQRSRIHIWIFRTRIGRKNGFEVHKNIFDLQKNILIHKWTQLSNIISA